MTQAAEAADGGHWEHFPHQADVGVRGHGPTLASALRQAAIAMTAVITDPDCVRAEMPVAITLRADSDEDLLYDWLNTLVFEMATQGMLFGRFDVAVDDGQLTATAWGERISVERHEPTVEIKGATYTGLRVYRTGDGEWVAECVIDV